MKLMLGLYSAIHAFMAALFAVAALTLIAIAARIAWAAFIRLNRYAEVLEPEAMAEAKREDAKLK
jgi:hypothetical protein